MSLGALTLLFWVAGSSVQAANNPSGWVQNGAWNLLMPLNGPGCDGGGATNMLSNWVAPHSIATDDPRGANGEVWADIDFNGTAAAGGWGGDPVFFPDPIWFTVALLNGAGLGVSIGPNDVVDFEDMTIKVRTAVGSDFPDDNVIGVATTYVNNKTGGPLNVTICSASDDAIQVYVNNCVNTNFSVCRGTAGDCDGPQNPSVLVAGINKIAVLVWEGGGGWGFRLAVHRASDNHRYTDADSADLEFVDPNSAAGKAAKTPILECLEVSRSVSGGPAYACPLGAADKATVKVVGKLSGDPAGTVHFEETVQANCMSKLSVTNVSNGGTVTPLTTADSSQPVITDLPNAVHVGGDAGGVADATGSGLGPYNTVDSSAGDMWTGGDTFEFQYAKVTGDFDIACDITGYSHTANGGQRRWGRYGLIARNFVDETMLATETFSKYTLVYREGPTNVEANAFEQGRINQDQIPDDGHYNDGANGLGGHPRFLRLTRRGNVVQGWGSQCTGLGDGTLNPRNDANWLKVGRADDWGAAPDVMVGFCNSEHNSDGINVQTVDYKLLTGGTGGSATNTLRIAWDTTRAQLNAGLTYVLQYAGRETSRHKASTTLAGVALVDKGGGATFDNTQTGPIGIFANSHDIGGPRTAGSTTFSAGTYTVVSSGDDIWAGGDQFQFAYIPVTGDFQLEAHVSDRKNSEWDGRWGKHGLMARNTCDFNSKYSHIQTYLVNFGNYPGDIDTPRHAHRVNQFDTGATRENYGVDDGAFALDPSTAAYNPAGTVRWPSWMRLIRRGKAIHSFLAIDDGAGHPLEWKAVGADSNPANPDTMLVGLALTSHAGNETAEVSFDHVSLTPLTTPVEACSAGVAIPNAGTAFTVTDGTDPSALGLVNVQGGGFKPVITGGRLQVTNESTGGSANAVWFPTDGANIASIGFVVDFDAFDTRDPTQAPADGMTFAVVQGNAAFAAGLRGDGGGSLGYDGNSIRDRSEGHASFAVEMDNWQTGGEPGNEGIGSPDNQRKYHMGIDVMSSVSSIQTNDDFGALPGASLPDIFDPAGIHVQVVYKPTGSINVYVSGNNGSVARTKVLSAMIPPLTGPDILLGWTGGTGGATATQEIDNAQVSTLCCEESADTASIAGPAAAAAGATVTLNGTAGGIDTGKTATYKWTIASGAGTIDGADNGATVKVKSTAAGATTARLKVTDGVCSDAGYADHTVTFCADFTLAVAGSDTAFVGDTVNLTSTTDASAPATYLWSIDSGSGTLGPATDPAVDVTSASAGDTVVKLTVTDGCGTAKSATHKVTFKAKGGSRKPMDENEDGKFDLSDMVSILNYLFTGTNPTLSCGDGTREDPANQKLLDSNGDSRIDLSDPVRGLTFLFSGGPQPINCSGSGDTPCPCIVIPGCVGDICTP